MEIKESKEGNPVIKARQKGQSGPSLTLTRTGLATFSKVQPFLSMSISEPIPSRVRGKKDQLTSKRAYSGHSCPPSYSSCAIPPSNQRAVDSITGDSGHPNYETAPSFKDLIGNY